MMSNGRIRLLYVDDEPNNLTAFRATFRRDFEVFTASTGEEAIQLLEKETIPVVISDQRMPGITGAELLGRVRQRWPRTVRFLMTGYSDLEAVVSAVNEGGIHAYITKPWDPVDLRLRIEQAYEVHALRDERENLYQRYRQLFEGSGDPIIIVDRSGRFMEANGAALKLVAMDKPGLLATDVQRFVKDLSGLVGGMLRDRAGNTFHNVEVSITTAEGHPVDCLMTLTRLKGEGDDVHYQAVLKDITDRRKEEERLKRLNRDLDRRVNVRTKQLSEALDDLGAFSYSVAHDLRSPLKNIRALSEHLAGSLAISGSTDDKDLSDRIHKASIRLITLVDDLLRFARTDNHDLQREDVDLHCAMRECLGDMQPDHEGLRVVMPEMEQAVVHADRAMVTVALNNLLSNAIKFSRGNPEPRIELGYRREADGDVIWLKDNGVGFDPSKNELVFGVFKRLHRSDQFEGTGIGLAIVQRIMRKHSGDCWAESEPGKGATFFLKFPLRVETHPVEVLH